MAKLIDQKWEDLDGRKHRLYVVRSMGSGEGFGILNVLTNTFLWYGYSTRKNAYAVLHGEKSLERYEEYGMKMRRAVK
jgi:hypothetical protein